MLLSLENVHTRIGASPVHRNVCVEVLRGEVVAILGSNGAGKTSLLRATMGLLPIVAGHVRFDDQDVSRLAPHARNRLGIAYVPEGRRIFGPMSVKENLEMGSYGVAPSGPELQARLLEMYRRFPVLQEKANADGSSLSGGQQQMLAIARALMSRPRLLLLDEPSLGLAPQMVRAVHDTIKMLRSERDTSVLLVEQNAGLALSVADRVYLMSRGAIVAHGRPAELSSSDALRSLYLGHDDIESEEVQ